MDWVHLGLILLVAVSNIEAQQGYSYPKPKTPFSGDVSTDNRPPSSPTTSGGFPSPTIESQQPSGGYSGSRQPGATTDSQRTFGTQQPATGYPDSRQAGAPSSTQTPFGTQQASYSRSEQPGSFSGTQRPFGAPQPTPGYPGSTQPGGFSGRSFDVQQPSTGYPSTGQSGVQKPFGTQASAGYPSQIQPEIPSGGVQEPSARYPGTPSGAQASFGTQQPSSGYPGSRQPVEPTATQRPFEYQQSTSGFPSGTSPDAQRPFNTVQPSTGYTDSRRPGAPTTAPFGSQQPSTGSFGAPRAGGSTQQSGYPSTATPTEQTRPTGTQGFSNGFQGKSTPETGRQEGYNYPTPQKTFPGSGQISSARPGESTGSSFEQGPSSSQTGIQPGKTDFTRPSQFASDGERFSSGQGRPTGQQFSSGFPRPSRPDQQASQGYPQTGPPTDSSQPEQGSQFPSTDGRGINDYSGERPGGQFPAGPAGAPEKPTSGQFPSANLGSQESPRRPVGYSKSLKPTGTQFSPDGSTGSVGQVTGFPTTSDQSQGTANLKPDSFSTISRPSRPQLPLEDKPNLASYPKNGERPITSYLPPGQGTIEGPTSQFPSFGVTSPRTPTQDTSFSRKPFGSQFPSGPGVSGTTPSIGGRPTGSELPSEIPQQPESSRTGYGRSQSQFPSGFPSQQARGQNGYGSSGVPTSIRGRPAGSDLPSAFPEQPQDGGYGVTTSTGGRPLQPSGFPGQTNRFQDGFGGSRTPTVTGGRPSESGLPSRTGGGQFQFPSGQQSGRPQDVYGSPGTSTSIGGRQPESQLSIASPGQSAQQPQNAFNLPGRAPLAIRPSGTQTTSSEGPFQPGLQQGYPTSGKPFSQQFGRPGSQQATQEGAPQPLGDQTFPGSQQDFNPSQRIPSEEGNYDEEEQGDYSAIPGEPGRDYPILSEVPETSFNCDDQEFRGYYADVEARCQIFHICANNKTYDFLCPNGTIFHQEHLVCVWWNQFDCETAPSLYRINENIYDYSIVGAQQTGAIPVAGRDYPDLSEGTPGFPLGGTPSGRDRGQGQQRPTTGIERSGSEEGQGFSGGYSNQGTPGTSIQRPGERPQGPPGPSSTGYPSGGQQGAGQYQVSSGESQRPIGGSTGFSGAPGRGYSDRQSKSQSFPGERPSPQGGDQGFIPSQRPGQYKGEDINRPTGGYSSERPQDSGFPSGPGSQTPASYGPPETPRSQPGINRPTSPGGQRSGSYGVPGTSGSQAGVDRPTSPTGFQTAGGYSNERPQGLGFPTAPGSQKPGGYGVPETPGSQQGISRPTTPGFQSTGGYTSERPQDSGFSSAPGGQRPGGYGVPETPGSQQGVRRPTTPGFQSTGGYTSERPQDSGFSSAPGGQRPGGYGQPETPGSQSGVGVSRPQEPSGYSTGTSPRPGFPSSGAGAPFSGSSQAKQPTREYLPSV